MLRPLLPLFCVVLPSAVAAQSADALFISTFERCDGSMLESVYAAPGTWLEAAAAAWPAPNGNAFAIDVPEGKVISLAFVAGTGTAGSVEFAERASLAGGALAVSISSCRADFRSTLNTATQSCLAYDGTPQPRLIWTLGASAAGSCPLQAGQTYFLNLSYHAIPWLPGAAPTCADARCGTWVVSRPF